MLVHHGDPVLPGRWLLAEVDLLVVHDPLRDVLGDLEVGVAVEEPAES
jgi:hypothetical protein